MSQNKLATHTHTHIHPPTHTYTYPAAQRMFPFEGYSAQRVRKHIETGTVTASNWKWA